MLAFQKMFAERALGLSGDDFIFLPLPQSQPLALIDSKKQEDIESNIGTLQGDRVASPLSLAYSPKSYVKASIQNIYDTAVFDKVEIPATDLNEIKNLEDQIASQNNIIDTKYDTLLKKYSQLKDTQDLPDDPMSRRMKDAAQRAFTDAQTQYDNAVKQRYILEGNKNQYLNKNPSAAISYSLKRFNETINSSAIKPPDVAKYVLLPDTYSSYYNKISCKFT